MRWLPTFMCVALLSCAMAAPGRTQPSIVILVRHAERDTLPANDPVLAPAGRARAEDLVRALSESGAGSVITTQLQRTRITAGPLASALGLTPIVVAATGDLTSHVDSVVDTILSRPAGEVVVVVGHTLTVPAIVAAMGGPAIPTLCEMDYSTLLVLILRPGRKPGLIRAEYGSESDLTSCR